MGAVSTPPATSADVAALPHPAALPRAVLRELAGGGDWLSSWWTVAAAGVVVVVLVALAVGEARRTTSGHLAVETLHR